MRRTEPLSVRQARVGIVANPVDIRLQAHMPRDVWTRWPDLRSRRRRHGARAKDAAPEFGDPVLDGMRLGDFARDLRAGVCEDQTRMGRMAVLWGARPVVVIFGVVLIAAALGIAVLR